MAATTPFRRRIPTPFRSRAFVTVLLAIAALLAGLAGAEAAVPKMCIGNAIGVPGSSGPPDWFTAGQTTTTGDPNKAAYQPFDPRWRGAMSLDYGSGSLSQVEFLALQSQSGAQQYLHLSWQVKSIPQFGLDNTALYAGFYSPAADKGALIKVTLKQTSTGADANFPSEPQARSAAEMSSGVPYFDVALTTGAGKDPATWTAPATTPAWLTDTLRVWANAQVNPYKWTVQARVPLATTIASGIDLPPASFRMWDYVQIEALLSAATPPAIVPYTWPRPDASQPVLTYASFQQGIAQKYPTADIWGEFALVADPSTDASCGGVFLANDHIGTRNTPGSSEINLDADNTFFAEPENKATAIGNNVVSATWRIANWGSQVGDTSAASWTAPTELTNVQGPAIAAGAFGNIEAHWNPSLKDADICPFIGQSGAGGVAGRPACPNPTPTRMLHQCILVKLTGPGVNFVRDSAGRNMNFVKASRFEREAEISVVGLPGLPGGKRDVFLYSERRNMPRYRPGGGPAPTVGIPRELAGGGYEYAANIPQRQPSDEQIADYLPTWVAHGYHDSGERIHLGGKDYPVLRPQTAFGYFVTHDGELQGWADVIDGAQRLRDDLYKVSPPNNGAVRVNTVIQAVQAGEPVVGSDWKPDQPVTPVPQITPQPVPSPVPPLPWWRRWWWLLLIVVILIVVILRRR